MIFLSQNYWLLFLEHIRRFIIMCSHYTTWLSIQVLLALRRLKGTSNNKKEKMPAERKQLFDQLTEDAMALMENGEFSSVQFFTFFFLFLLIYFHCKVEIMILIYCFIFSDRCVWWKQRIFPAWGRYIICLMVFFFLGRKLSPGNQSCVRDWLLTSRNVTFYLGTIICNMILSSWNLK